jgi:cytidylate kinase
MAMTAITISREIGSQGDWIAGQVARRLDYRLITKDTLEHIFRQYGFVDFKETYDQTGFWTRFDPHHDELVSLLNRLILALAAHGNVVLVGRGGFAMLKDYADVLNVRIQAPILIRIEQTMREQNLGEVPAAEALVNEQDRIRQNFLLSTYGKNWDSASAFDLVIDTGKISPYTAVNWLVDSARNLADQKFETRATCSELNIDPVLAQTVAESLSREPAA